MNLLPIIVFALLTSQTNTRESTENTVVRFSSDWQWTVDGPLISGSEIRIVYDLDRFKACSGEYHGLPTWHTYLEYQIDGGEIQKQKLHELRNNQIVPLDVLVTIPPDSKQLVLWFHRWDYYGCEAYDSRFGRNYVLSFTN